MSTITASNAPAPTAEAGKRLQKELMSLMMDADDLEGLASAFPDEDNLFKWVGTIKGSDATVFEGLEYAIAIAFPGDYPYTAPKITFTTPIFHPNVDTHGNICLDILKEKWSAAYSVKTMLMSLQSLLGEPNNESPLNVQAAQLWENQAEYKRQTQKKHADGTA